MADVEKHSTSNEKVGLEQDELHYSSQSNPNYVIDIHDIDKVQRRLKERHVQMIAIAGTIGTGLFLGSGLALRNAGPLGALIAYALVGTVAYSSLCSIGEMTTHAPISGTFPHFAGRWVDPALGFAVGWNYFYTNAISIPVEITAAVLLITFWDTNVSHAPIYTAVLCIIVCAINILGVRYFGESEFLFALIKISLIIGLILAGLVVDLGGGPDRERIGFRYWKHPGPFAGAGLVSNVNTDRFLGVLSVLVQAAFSYQAMELVAIAASETESPRRNISKAIKRVFWRILTFYILGILIIGMLVSSGDDELLNDSGTAAQSPFVIAMNKAGIKVLPHIVNAGIFTSALSAGNSYLFCSSRVLYGLALRGQAPKLFTYCTRNGLPLNAVIATGLFSFFSFMNVSAGSETVFNWFVNLVATGGFFSWLTSNITYLYFYRGMKAQGFDLKKNVYYNSWQPFVAWWGVGWTAFFILVNGFTVFFSFDVSAFFTSYINIPIFFGLYFGYKIFMKTKIWKPEEMDLVTGIPTVEETEIPESPPKNIWERMARIIF